ncbi:MAG TPA: cbb3-type cytochrome oxidase assembly protein CcoS [Phycisphaerales bacterium]|nr:cbb3-type cytochrome oxidase assembly protein CcoS [Phycisphaerales bacterium]HRQ74345.1 cbb3-type cytochrome oxidase assembly protein CcoS [Phycisphaerales bacterium]
MSMIFIILPLAIVIAACAMAGFIWAVRRGQFDDLDSPPWRALHDEPDVSNQSTSRRSPN